MEEIQKPRWKGKHIFVRLKSGTLYTGLVIEEELYSEKLSFLTILDKFGKQVTFSYDSIELIKEDDGR
jgi:hypothetical protein